jgi:hypothetical protein
MWPWSEFRRLKLERNEAEAKLHACGLAASGVYAALGQPNVYSKSLVAVIALQKRCERLEKELAVGTDRPLPT